MAAPMRDSAVEGGHRTKVADPRTAAATNFEYDDNEWDIGIGDLIIDLDADIEKTNEKAGDPAGGQMAQAAGKTKMAVEHSATVQDKGLKMKIKRTKPGTKTSEAKHEIVKSGEQNGSEMGVEKGKHSQGSGMTKRVSGGHRKDKTRERHCSEKALTKPSGSTQQESSVNSVNVNGVVRGVVSVNSPTVAAPPGQQQSRSIFPASHGPGPPPTAVSSTPSPPIVVSTPKAEPPRLTSSIPSSGSTSLSEERSSSTSPPPSKKSKTVTSEIKEMIDVCVGTSIGTITEPDCLGPCEPGTSVTLEGIVWHETEGGVLVVNVTWRGKTYVGTLLDCTRHDWAPPRFCDSPTSDLDARTPKGRGKRGRTSSSTNSTGDLSNFTETRSSVHSKLRNGNSKGGRGGRGNTPASNSSGSNSTGSNSPTPFLPPKQDSNKKSKERDTTPTPMSKKNKTPLSAPSSPPASPMLLECPEPNCSKKYKHINGLKYHQSHAHGSADDEDTKDATSFSENEESNTEAPSPSATPVKSPQDKTEAPRKEEQSQNAPVLSPSLNSFCQVPQDPLPLSKSSNPESPNVSPAVSLTSRALTPQPSDLPVRTSSPVSSSSENSKNLVKPGVLRFGPPNEEYSVGSFPVNKSVISPVIPLAGSSNSVSNNPVTAARTSNTAVGSSLGQITHSASIAVPSPQNFSNSTMPVHLQPPTQNCLQNQPTLPPSQTLSQGSVPQHLPIKLPQFKVKPTASLMPDDKNKERERNSKVPPNYKKKSRKSPAGSPHPPNELPFGIDSSGREDLQSPAYSDISDDAAPILESEVGDKAKPTGEKKGESNNSGSPHGIPSYGIYGSFYGQPPYLVPSVQPECKSKENSEKLETKTGEKEVKKEPTNRDYSQKLIQHPSHYYSYGYVPSYPGNFIESSYPMIVTEEKNKETTKGDKSPGATDISKHGLSPIQVPNPAKVKQESGVKESKHSNENHQIIKESIEMKNQMNSYLYGRQSQSQSQSQSNATQDDLKRYLYQRGREQTNQTESSKQSSVTAKNPPSNQSPKHKDRLSEEKKEEKVKQEGQKPTMETQGPPPPPTSQYYIHPSYMQSPHYGALPFDPSHPVYRNINQMLVPGPYTANPYLGIPRYHTPEDLSRSTSGTTKALDLLQHHASQYYSSHKIHELQERALKSPTPTKSTSRESPSAIPPTRPPSGPPQAPPTTSAGSISGPSPPIKPQLQDSKDSRSPPPQRHVHTHHHTHVGLTYPILTGQYPAPYGAAVLASQQAAAVAASVMNPYPPK